MCAIHHWHVCKNMAMVRLQVQLWVLVPTEITLLLGVPHL